MVTPSNVFNTVSDLVEALGFRSPEQYFTDPLTVDPPEPIPDPAAEAVKAASEVEFMRVELERQGVELERDKLMFEIKKMELDHEAKIQKLRSEGYPAEPDLNWTIPPPEAPPQPLPEAAPQPEPAGAV
jgi:hypothetical protein